jgi:sterol desaturase/sphingolipid hydroxylase (fatty acid hydroxylase superfamily)
MDLMPSEGGVRLAAFLAIFGSMAVFELVSPRLQREEMAGALKAQRWLTNLSMVVLSSVLLRIVFPAAAVGAAIWTR